MIYLSYFDFRRASIFATVYTDQLLKQLIPSYAATDQLTGGIPRLSRKFTLCFLDFLFVGGTFSLLCEGFLLSLGSCALSLFILVALLAAIFHSRRNCLLGGHSTIC